MGSVKFKARPSDRNRAYCSRKCYDDAADYKRPLDRMHNGRPALMDSRGYVLVYEPDYFHRNGGWIYEHRLVVEKAIGRRLERHEAVHHKNGVKDDNHLENLEIMDALAHATLSVRDYWSGIKAQLAELEEYRRRFGPIPD